MARLIEGSNFDILFAKVIAEINTHPEYTTSPRGQLCREIIAPVLVLDNPRARLLANPARKADYGFGVGEFLWYWEGKRDLETMLYYNKRMANFSDDGETLKSAYGNILRPQHWVHKGRTHNQWTSCKAELLKDRDSRRAIMMIQTWDNVCKLAVEDTKDFPCTLNLQFFIRDNRLHLHVNMRSNDAFWGLTYDLFSFTLLQEMMMWELRDGGYDSLQLGEYTHCAGSLHIYEKHFKDADEVVKAYLSKEFKAAAPMEPLMPGELASLAEQEDKLRTGKVAEIGEAQFSSGARWMAERLNEHRRKRDGERERSLGSSNSNGTAL